MHAIDDISRELLTQAAFLKAREPVYERVLELLDDALRGEFGLRLVKLWADRNFNASYERPLLLLAALRYDALCEGATHPLYAALAQEPVQVEALAPAALAAAISPARTRFLRALRERAVQTNETTRAVTWLWPAHLLWSAGERRALALVDLGTSAGLNLIADGLPALWFDENDHPIPIAPRAAVALRLGFDIAPLDVRRDDDATWLRACVWPSDRARLSRLEQGIALFGTGSERADAPRLETCALPDVPDRLDSLPGDLLVLCVQTIVRDYLRAAERERYERGMREFLLRRPPLSAVVAELELDQSGGEPVERGAVVTVRFAAQNGAVHELSLARTYSHPRQLFTNAAAIDAFTSAFAKRASVPSDSDSMPRR